MTADYPGREPRYAVKQGVWGVVTGEPDWRALDRLRIADREARGLPVYRCAWTCDHLSHDPTDQRGPVRVSQARWKRHQQFVLWDRPA